MHRKRLGFCAAIFLVVSAASSAPAADENTPGQTPEGAQTMLTLLASQGTVNVDVDTGMGFNVTSATNVIVEYLTVDTSSFWGGTSSRGYSRPKRISESYVLPARKLLSSTSTSACKTELVFSDDQSKRVSTTRKHNYISPDGSTYVGEAGLTVYAQGYTAATLDWTKMARVEAIGSTVVMSPLSPNMRLQLPSPALAARVAFAMEFLRMSCDPLGKTGF